VRIKIFFRFSKKKFSIFRNKFRKNSEINLEKYIFGLRGKKNRNKLEKIKIFWSATTKNILFAKKNTD
jgi:hypothetical protein